MFTTAVGLLALAVVVGAAWILRRRLQKIQAAEEDANRARLLRVHHDAAQREIAAMDYRRFIRRHEEGENTLSRGRAPRLSGRQDLRGPRHGR